MKFCAQPPPPSSTHDPAKGSHSYSTPFLVQLGVLPTSSTTTAATITTATRWKERGEEQKGGRIGRKGDGGRGIDMHLSSSVVASGCSKSRRRNLWKTRETRAESLFRRRKNRGERRREATRQEIGITKAFFENIALMRPIWGETRFRGWCDSIDCCRRVVSMRIRWGDRVACYLGFYVCRD